MPQEMSNQERKRSRLRELSTLAPQVSANFPGDMGWRGLLRCPCVACLVWAIYRSLAPTRTSTQVDAVIGALSRRKKRDKIILGVLIGFCSAVLFVYAFG